ncbi:MAG: biopolymer transporter ExbD [Gemmataceae bacterium]
MAPKHLDVWLVASNTVYKGVPFAIAAGWAEQGRLAKTDKVRPAGGPNDSWKPVSQLEQLADYLFGGGKKIVAANDLAESLEKVEIDPAWPRSVPDDDDDVDMIPLIDISLVLLIFFMMTSVVSSFSPVQVPGMQYGAEISEAEGGISILIDRDSENKPLYSLQVGNGKPKQDDTGRGDRDKLLVLLDLELNGRTKRPEVRIACHEKLPRWVVGELCTELQKRVERDLITRYTAEVNEKKN